MVRLCVDGFFFRLTAWFGCTFRTFSFLLVSFFFVAFVLFSVLLLIRVILIVLSILPFLILSTVPVV